MRITVCFLTGIFITFAAGNYAFSKTLPQNDINKRIEYVNIAFWEQFEDEYLKNYILCAVKNNHEAKSTLYKSEQFRQEIKSSFANELPSLNVAANYLGLKIPMLDNFAFKKNGFVLPFQFNYEADLLLKNRDKTKSVQTQYEASLLDERAAYISVASAVGTVYFNIVNADKSIELQEEINAQRQEIYDLMLLSNREGLVSSMDTIQANQALIKGQTDLAELKKQREKMLNQLAVLIGESPENTASLKRISLDELIIANRIPAGISSDIIENRPDYLKAAKLLEKAGIDIRVAKKEFLPTINLSGLAFFNSMGGMSNLLTTRNMLWSLGAGTMLPLFTGGQRIANLRLKKAQYERLLQSYLKTNLSAIQEVNDAMVSAKLDWDKLQQTLKQQALEEKDYNFNEMKYDEGVISKLDLIQFRENLLTINQLAAKQKIEYLVDYIGLYKACGAQI